MEDSISVVLVSGNDSMLTADKAIELAKELGDISEIDGDNYSSGDVIADTAQVPLFGTKTVLVRRMSRLGAGGANEIAKWLEQTGTSVLSNLVMEWDSGKAPVKLVRAVEGMGGVHHKIQGPKNQRETMSAVRDYFRDTELVLDSQAVFCIADCIGTDIGRLPSIADVLESTYGPGSRLGAEHVEPTLTDWSDLPPWDLTDAIDKGDMSTSLEVLQRMWSARRHPLQVMASLVTHYNRVARLDGAGARNEKEAASVLGMNGSTFPAKKALSLCNRLGSDKIADIYGLMLDAEVDIKGRSGLDGEHVVEVLCARLAALTARKS